MRSISGVLLRTRINTATWRERIFSTDEPLGVSTASLAWLDGASIISVLVSPLRAWLLDVNLGVHSVTCTRTWSEAGQQDTAFPLLAQATTLDRLGSHRKLSRFVRRA